MDTENFPLNVKDCSDAELYLTANLQKIASSRHLVDLLKEYLDEPDDKKRQLVAAQIMLNMEDKE